ncbi:MAG: sigma-E processing peptidase SpoIIGA [Eubacteriales bacterium]|nr:sigma-E processing peptidase SpoIIGA [Eubacteriales bacterium]
MSIGEGKSVHYELYVDRIFFLHLGMNFLLLFLTDKLGAYRAGIKRLAGAAAAGTFFFLIVLLAPLGMLQTVRAVKIVLYMAGTFATIQFAFRFRSRRNLTDTCAIYIAAAFLMGGVTAAGAGMKSRNVFQALIWAATAAAAGGFMIRKRREREKNPFWRAELRINGACIETTALADSGNSLYDPITQCPVCIASKELAEKLGLLRQPDNFRIIPYHSIGKQHGLLKAAAVDEMYLQKEGRELLKKRVLVAVSEQELSKSKRYQLLLHPAILEEKKGENHDIESSDAGKDAV